MKGVVNISNTPETEVPEDIVEEKIPVAAKVFSILFSIFVYLLAAAILVGAILFSFSTSPDKSIFGFRYYTVLTGSMEPTYKVGDMIFVQLKGAEDINVGDVITFNPSQDSDAYLTHRVTEKYENYQNTGVTCFRTRGDNNSAEDSFLIESDRVIGTVNFGIPALGYIVRFVQLRWYIVVPIAVMIPVFFYLLKRYFMLGKDDEDDEEDEEGDDGDNSRKKDKKEGEAEEIGVEEESAGKSGEAAKTLADDTAQD